MGDIMCLRLQKKSQQTRKSGDVGRSSDFLAYPPKKSAEIDTVNLWTQSKASENSSEANITLNWLVGAFLLAVGAAICGVTLVGVDVVLIAQSFSVGFALIFAAILFYGMMVLHPFQAPERRRYVTLAKEESK